MLDNAALDQGSFYNNKWAIEAILSFWDKFGLIIHMSNKKPNTGVNISNCLCC